MAATLNLGRIPSFLKEVRSELTKVSWLNRKQTTKLTLVVIAVSVVVAAFISTLDFIFTKMMKIFI